MNIQQRLQRVLDYINGNTRIADIGSDHAKLLIKAHELGKLEFGIAGEVVNGPFNASVEAIQSAGLSHKVDVRLGDGLTVVNPSDEIDTATICGMGQELIAHILHKQLDRLNSIQHVICQSNTFSYLIRDELVAQNFEIMDELIMRENGHTYEIIYAKRNHEKVPKLSEKERQFGPVLLKEKGEMFDLRYQNEIQHLEKIVHKIDESKHRDKVVSLTERINMIKEVIDDENQ